MTENLKVVIFPNFYVTRKIKEKIFIDSVEVINLKVTLIRIDELELL